MRNKLMKRLLKDEQAGAMVFSAFMMMVLVFFVSYTVNVSDLTNEKMKTQNGADAIAYSGARVRANLYNSMGFLNMVKVALYRLLENNAATAISPGQWTILADFARLIPSFVDDPNDIRTWEGMGTSDILYLANLADQAQIAISNNFDEIVSNEIQQVALTYNINSVTFTMGQTPVFHQIDLSDSEYNLVFFRNFCQHVVELQHWIEPEPSGCEICEPYQSWLDYEYITQTPGPDVAWLLDNPLYDFPMPIIIGHSESASSNTTKVVARKNYKEAVLFPYLFHNSVNGLLTYASAGTFSDSFSDYDNLYITNFTAKLVGLDESGFFNTYHHGQEPLPELPEISPLLFSHK
jgi:hypothetical protein